MENTYIVRKAGDRRDPNLVGSDREMRVGGDEKMMEQTHVCHGL